MLRSLQQVTKTVEKNNNLKIHDINLKFKGLNLRKISLKSDL